MGNEILSTIFAVEQEIQERLAAEEQRAAQMLDDLRRELELEAAREGERLAASMSQAVAAAKTETQGRAAALLRRAKERAEQLDGLADETLERCIVKYLGWITGERSQ